MHERCEFAVAAVAEIDAERVEHVVEEARHRQQHDAPAVPADARFAQLRLDLRFQRRIDAPAVIAVEEGHEASAIVRKEPQPTVQRRQLIQIQREHEYAIAQPVFAGAVVRRMSGVERAHAAIASRAGSCPT